MKSYLGWRLYAPLNIDTMTPSFEHLLHLQLKVQISWLAVF